MPRHCIKRRKENWRGSGGLLQKLSRGQIAEARFQNGTVSGGKGSDNWECRVAEEVW